MLAAVSLTAAACNSAPQKFPPTSTPGHAVTPAATTQGAPGAVATISTSGSDRDQIEALIRGFSERTEALDADAAFALLCDSLKAKSDLKQIKQNMEGFKNAGSAAPQISNLTFVSIDAKGDEGEARYTYTQVFRGETKTINEGVKVAKEKGRWCMKDQLLVPN